MPVLAAKSSAPDFRLPSLGPAPLGLEDLLAEGPVLLCFVTEECPTSALALRRLASLVEPLAAAGIGFACVCEEPPEVAARVARRARLSARVLCEPPPFETSRAYGLDSVPTTVLVDAHGTIVETVVGWDKDGLDDLLRVAAGLVGAGPLEVTGEKPRWKPGCQAKSAYDPGELGEGALALDELEDMFERGWTDGLPVVPPTRERVETMLGSCDPARSLGPVPPGMGEATLERVASCAVLAGCTPAYFPVVLAAVEAALEPVFNLHGQAVTTQPGAPIVVVNGPIRGEIGLNCGMGALGPGWRANATIGRAVRLVMTLTGDGAPGRLDRSTLGQPGKVGLCFGENEELSPWPPLHVERGFPPEASTVTLFAGEAPHSIADHRSRTPEDLAWTLGWAAASAWSTSWWPLGAPSLFVVGPEHAVTFARHGWDKARVRQAIFEGVRKPARELRRGEATQLALESGPEATIHKWRSPEDLAIVVAGGEAGRFSAVIAPCEALGWETVTKEVRWST